MVEKFQRVSPIENENLSAFESAKQYRNNKEIMNFGVTNQFGIDGIQNNMNKEF